MVKIFKLSKRTSKTFPAERTIFERVTREAIPFYQENSDGQKRQYAVCPGCNNPIQIIGLYNRLKHTDNPFGRHSPRPVDGFTFDPAAYEFCPYLVKSTPTDKASRRELSPFSCDILKLVIDEYDRVVRVLREDMGFNFSAKFAQNMLRSYLKEQGYLYPAASLRNIPWIVGYLSFSKSLVGQYLKSDSPQYAALNKAITGNIPQATVTDKGWLTRKANTGFNLQCFFTNHRMDEAKGGDLRESIQFVMITGRAEGPDGIIGTEIWDEKIIFDHPRFEHLVQIKTQKYRDTKLLEMAKTELQTHLRHFPQVGEYFR